MSDVNPYKQRLDAITYESYVAETYQGLLGQDLGAVFQGKVYVGRRSSHSHKIDVSIETMVAGVAIVILIECKFYKNAVEISDILEFAERIDDIGAHKGIVVTTVGFQEGCFRVARGRGIALVRTEPIWQTVQHSRDEEGHSHGMYLGKPYIGGSNGDRFLGTTIDAINIGVAPSLDRGEAWKLTVMHLVDPEGKFAFNTQVERNCNWQIVGDEPVKRFRNRKRLAPLVERIERESLALSVNAARHALFGDVCPQCGCSLEAIVNFGWWECKRANIGSNTAT